MKEIAQLIIAIESISAKSNSISKAFKFEGLESSYVNGITHNEFKSDNDAAYNLYKTDQTDVRYKMLKYRIKKKIYNQLLSIEIRSTHQTLKKEQECLKLITISKLLLKKLQYSTVLNLCNKIKAIALPYEFNDLLLLALEIEATCLADMGSFKEYERKSNEVNKYAKIVNLERESVILYQKSKLLLKSTIKNRKELLEDLPNTIERIRNIWEHINTYKSYDAFLKTSIFYYELTGKFNKIIQVCEEANNLVKEGIINNIRFNGRYNAYILIYAHIRTKNFENGLYYAEKYNSFFEENNLNWFPYMENYFLLAVHSRNYELSSLLLNKVKESLQFNDLAKEGSERWQLYEAYLHFFKPELSTQENISYQSFISSFTEYSKDKQGFNVAILILQFMYFLRKNDSESLLYRIESLKKYSSTHLKDAASLRSKLFLKLLMLIVTEDFDAEASREKGAKYYKKLSVTPIPGDAYAEIEIIPYEHLWEMVLQILEERN